MSDHAPASLSAQDLTAFFHAQIPLTRALGVAVEESSAARLVLTAPLAPNRNHLGTAFGGSLHALPTLACYGMLWLLVREGGLDSHVVVKHSEASYRDPVTGPLRAVCARPEAALTADFMRALRRHKKARMDLTAIVAGATPDRPAVDYRGSFVALIQ